MFIHYPNYTHRIPTVSPGLLYGGGLIQGRIFGLVHRWPIFRGLYSGFYGILENRIYADALSTFLPLLLMI